MIDEKEEEYNEEEILILLHEVLAKLDRLEKAVRKVVDKEIEEENNKLQEQLESIKNKKNNFGLLSDNTKRFKQDFPDLLREREIAYKRLNSYGRN